MRIRVVIGVGINIAMPQHSPSPITQDWTDLQKIMGKRPARNLLAATLLNEIIAAIYQFKDHNLRTFLSEWQQLDCTYNKEVTLQWLTKWSLDLLPALTKKANCCCLIAIIKYIVTVPVK